MTIFWILAALLSVVASCFILVPLLMSANKKQMTDQFGDQFWNLDRNEVNVSIFRDRLAELESGRQSGELSEGEFALCKAELEQTLLLDVGEARSTGRFENETTSLVIPVIAACTIPLLAILLYADWGGSLGSIADVELAQQLQQPERAPHEQRSMDEALASLQSRLMQQPENHEGWFLLGRSMLARGSYAEAVDAFTHLLISFPEDATMLANQAQAMYLADGRKLTARVKKVIDKTLSFQPNAPNIMEIFGMDAFDRREYPLAIDYFNKMLRQDIGEAQAQSIRDMIARASAQLPEGAVQNRGKEVLSGKSLDVLVEIDAQIDVAKDDVVFVFARALQGPAMPLAAKKLTVADLPTLVRLDDSMAMDPNFTLSKAKEVQIVARVARSGDVIARSGDWQAISDPLILDKEHSVIKLRISEAVR